MTLLLGDCLDVLKDVKSGSVDMVLADLPYGTTACKWDTRIPFEPLWAELHRVCKPNAAMCMFGSEPFSSHMRMSNLKQFKYDWIWKKSKPSGIATVKYMPMKNHEIISVFYGGKFYPIKEKRAESSQKRLSQGVFRTWNTSRGQQHALGQTQKKQVPELRYPTTVKEFASKSNNKECFHPTQKPIALLEYLIKTYTNEGDTVLDPTMGSGSVGVACRNLGRKFIGIEKEPKYFEIANQRISETHERKLQ